MNKAVGPYQKPTKSIAVTLALIVLRGYQFVVSPMLSLAFNMHCRYEESCSHYSARKMSEFGFVRGTLLGIRRILSCNPWTKPLTGK